jgi:hypothetical protein
LHSPGPIVRERTKSHDAEPGPDAVEPLALRRTAPAPVNTPGDVEGRSPIADPLEGVSFDPASSLKRAVPRRPVRIARFFRDTLKTAATLLIVVLAVLAALVIWDFYVTAPWTRDGRVRVQVAGVAPQVSGQITEIVVDNQYVRQGDVLYVIDPFDFRVTLDTAKAQLRQAAADLLSSGCRRSVGSTFPISPRLRRSSSCSSATPSRRRRSSTPPSSRSPGPTSTSSARRCAVR